MPYRELGTPEALKAAVQGIDHVIIDATERAYRRSQDDTKQREHYSGKKNGICWNVIKIVLTSCLRGI